MNYRDSVDMQVDYALFESMSLNTRLIGFVAAHASTLLASAFHLSPGQLTQRSDVYGFGVFLLELLSGRPAVVEVNATEREHLTAQVKPFLRAKRPNLAAFVDVRLGQEYNREGALRVAVIAKCCLLDEPKKRPGMALVVKCLKEVLDEYLEVDGVSGPRGGAGTRDKTDTEHKEDEEKSKLDDETKGV